MKVRTASERVLKARRIIIELLLASCPQSKVIQDIASRHNVRQQRFRQEHEDCIHCGLSVRMCNEQMMAGAIGFRGRGKTRSLGTPFDMKSDVCRCAAAAWRSARPVRRAARSISRKSDLRRLRQPCAAVHCEGSVPRYDVLHVTLRGL